MAMRELAVVWGRVDGRRFQGDYEKRPDGSTVCVRDRWPREIGLTDAHGRACPGVTVDRIISGMVEVPW